MYQPNPRDTSEIVLPTDLTALAEQIAEHVHDTWAKRKLGEGITTHPDLVPYAELSEATKQYDRDTAMQTLRLVVALGFDIVKRPEPKPAPAPLSEAELEAFHDLVIKHGAWIVGSDDTYWSVEFLGHYFNVQCRGAGPGDSIHNKLPGFKSDISALKKRLRP